MGPMGPALLSRVARLRAVQVHILSRVTGQKLQCGRATHSQLQLQPRSSLWMRSLPSAVSTRAGTTEARAFSSKATPEVASGADAAADMSRENGATEDAEAQAEKPGSEEAEDFEAGGVELESLQESIRRASAPPASWRHAAEWVDLEFERAGLGSLRSEGMLQSSWGEFPTPDSGVLWPHPALHEHRRRPFGLPVEAEAGASGKLQENRQRLASLWRHSSSHGISWDELDEAYVVFSRAGKRQYDEWARKVDSQAPPNSVLEKRRAKVRAKRHLQRFCLPGEDGKPGNPEEAFPSRVKRLAAKYYTREKRRSLGPWRPGKLSLYLRQLVAARVSRRESAERAYELLPSQG